MTRNKKVKNTDIESAIVRLVDVGDGQDGIRSLQETLTLAKLRIWIWL